MSERIDILTPSYANLPYITVNNAVNKVAITYAGGSDPTLINGYGQSTFARGDNFIVLSIGIVLPLSFQLHRQNDVAASPLILSFYGKALAKLYYFREFNPGGAGYVALPMENYETSLGVFVDIQNQDVNTGSYIKNSVFTLQYGIAGTSNVSMSGVPTALNGTVQRLVPFVKVLHTLALS
jgi:hypothetical protein